MGSKAGRGLKKGITPNRNLNLESLENQVLELRQKNSDYKKSLNVNEKPYGIFDIIFDGNVDYALKVLTGVYPK
jgi:hypothetical protein